MVICVVVIVCQVHVFCKVWAVRVAKLYTDRPRLSGIMARAGANTGFSMMTSSNGNIFRITAPLCGEFTGHRWISHHKGQWRGVLMFSLNCAWTNGWVNNRDAGDLRHHCVPYNITLMRVPVICVKRRVWLLHAIEYNHWPMGASPGVRVPASSIISVYSHRKRNA